MGAPISSRRARQRELARLEEVEGDAALVGHDDVAHVHADGGVLQGDAVGQLAAGQLGGPGGGAAELGLGYLSALVTDESTARSLLEGV